MKQVLQVLVVAMAVSGCSKPADPPPPPRTIEFFRANADVRGQVLKDCKTKANSTPMPECESASLAELQENAKKGISR
jgi:hypothetical protein